MEGGGGGADSLSKLVSAVKGKSKLAAPKQNKLAGGGIKKNLIKINQAIRKAQRK